MFKAALFTVLVFLCSICQAQSELPKNDSNTRTVELEEVYIKAAALKNSSYKKKVRSQNVHVIIPAGNDERVSFFDSTYFTTKFPQVDSFPISLKSVEVRLKPYDTALFDIKLIIYQPLQKDTLRYIITIDGGAIRKKNNLIALDHYDITLYPAPFYMGYGFHVKANPAPYNYRSYSSTHGEGALIQLSKTGDRVIVDPNLPYIFPFKITYRRR